MQDVCSYLSLYDLALRLAPVCNVEMSFRYAPLDSSQRQIRLLTLKRSNNSADHEPDNIGCSLTTQSLNSDVEFDALSYVWGDANDIKSITIDGHPVSVTRNLYVALQHFRSIPDAAPDHIWIDAICIDQNDLEERNSQVKLMGSIYGQAKEVLVWLGPATQYSAVFLAMMRNYNREWPEHLLDLPRTQEVLLDTLERPYWGRTWVLQEAALAQHVVAYLGTHRAPFWEVLETLVHVNKLLFQKPERLALLRTGGASFLRFETARRCAKQASTSILLDNDQASVKDRRDMVYGLLALTPSSFRIEPDYAVPIEEIFRDAAAAMVKCDRTLDHLLFTGTYEGKHPGLISWILDFTYLSLAVTNTVFNACGDRAKEDFFLADNNDIRPSSMVINARKIDEVDT